MVFLPKKKKIHIFLSSPLSIEQTEKSLNLISSLEAFLIPFRFVLLSWSIEHTEEHDLAPSINS